MSEEKDAIAQVNFADENSITKLLPKLKELREIEEKRKKHDKNSEALKEISAILQEEIYGIMLENRIPSIKHGGRLFYQKLDEYMSINKGNREKGFKWLEENERGWLIEKNVNAKTLTSQLKLFRDTGKDINKKVIGIKEVKRIGINRA